jgi:AcrR family transcriptional regulator
MRTPGSTGEETGRRVREAAVRLFAQRGFAATGIRELAVEADLTTAALYHYMGTKEDLLVEIMRSTIEPLIAIGHDVLAGDDPPEIKLATLVETHVWLHGTRPLSTSITDAEIRALSGQAHEDIMKLRDASDDVWNRIVGEGVEARRFDVIDARVATLAVLELCTGVSRWYTPGGRLDLRELCAIHADLAFGVLRVRRRARTLRRSDIELPSPATRFDAEHNRAEPALPAGSR